jgi:hypothetical protein
MDMNTIFTRCVVSAVRLVRRGAVQCCRSISILYRHVRFRDFQKTIHNILFPGRHLPLDLHRGEIVPAIISGVHPPLSSAFTATGILSTKFAFDKSPNAQIQCNTVRPSYSHQL